MDLFTNKDIIAQIASSSNNTHMQEIIGALITGSSVVMLHPEGNLDIKYVSTVVQEKQVSFMQSAPTYMSYVLQYLLKSNHSELSTFRSLHIRGMIFNTT
jgi:hypothetical protein